jgi:polar amino acid transport system substrate-binding protein
LVDGKRWRKHAWGLLAVLLATPAAAVLAADGELRVAASDANGRPFVLYDADGRFRGGLAADLMDHLAAELGLRARYLNLPRARVEPGLKQGEVDIGCFLAPEWVDDAAALRWTPVLFHVRQVIVSRAGSPPVSAAADLYGKRVGTLLNYVYPELEPYFSEGRIQRADAPSAAANIAKLKAGRIDAFMDVDLAILHAVETGELPLDVTIDLLWAADNPVFCAASPAFDRRQPGWRAVLERALLYGRMTGWMQRYTGGRRVSDTLPGVRPSS